MKYIKKIIFNANEFNFDDYLTLSNDVENNTIMFASNNDNAILIRNNYQDKNTTHNNIIAFIDKNNKIYGRIGTYIDENKGCIEMRLSDIFNDNYNTMSQIGIKQDMNTGEINTYCKTPSSLNSNSTEIATTAWVQSLLKSKGIN